MRKIPAEFSQIRLRRTSHNRDVVRNKLIFMNIFFIITFLFLSLLILILINYLIFKIISKNKKNLKTILLSATTSAIITTLALDSFDLLFRIITSFIASGKIAQKRIVMAIKLHYIFEIWIQEIILLFLIIMVLSLIVTLIINKLKVHKN